MAVAVQVIQSAPAAEKLLKAERLRILELLAEPDSATGLAKQLGMPRQTVNYHLRELEKEGFIVLVSKRRRRNCIERVVRATARSYVISPLALGAIGIDALTIRDQFSTAYLVSAAARAIRDVSVLRQKATKAGNHLATLTLESEIRFSSAKARHEFTEELLNIVARLVMKFHDESAEGGRSFRLLIGAYPVIARQEPPEKGSVRME